jgi:outer membrane protein
MSNIFLPRRILILLPLLLGFIYFSTGTAAAQSSPISGSDSLNLDELIQKVINTHPNVQAAIEALKAADARIALSKSYLLPDLDFNASYSLQGPVPSFEFPGFGTIKLMPENNYSAGLNARYSLYDFGRGAAETALETESKKLAELNIEQVKQKLSLGSVNVYFSLLFLQEAISIKQDQLKLLHEHLSFVEKKKETGSATDYELLSTKVNISNAESQEMDLESAWKTQQSVLNALLGDSIAIDHPVLGIRPSLEAGISPDSMLRYAYDNRDEMKTVAEKNIQAQLRYKFIQTQRKPFLSAFANAGGKNGYIPYLNDVKFNFAAGIGLRIPILDANRTRNNLLLAKSNIQSISYEEDYTRRTIRTELSENYNNLESARKKTDHNKLQLEQARQAYALAEVNYKAGALTSLDLFDAQDKVAQSRLQLLKSEIDFAFGLYKLKSALGERLY